MEGAADIEAEMVQHLNKLLIGLGATGDAGDSRPWLVLSSTWRRDTGQHAALITHLEAGGITEHTSIPPTLPLLTLMVEVSARVCARITYPTGCRSSR